MNRGSGAIGPNELLKRKDVWRLRPGGTVQFPEMVTVPPTVYLICSVHPDRRPVSSRTRPKQFFTLLSQNSADVRQRGLAEVVYLAMM